MRQCGTEKGRQFVLAIYGSILGVALGVVIVVHGRDQGGRT